jgi:hypothetical protein
VQKDIVSIGKLFDSQQSDPNSKMKSSFYDSFALRAMHFGFNIGMSLLLFLYGATRQGKRYLTTFLL